MKFTPKSFPQIVADQAAKLSAETPITDFTDGSVALTLLETSAQEDFQQYIQMLNIIRNYNLDTTEGEDLDKRAAEYGLSRKQSAPHSGFVSISDVAFSKISTKLYAGLSGPTAGSSIINIDDASSFPASGAIYIGRGTANSEGSISYSSAPINNGSYWTISLDVALINDHGTDESVILAQGGIRSIPAGTEVEIPESDVSEQVLFEINQEVVLLDGEDEVTNILVTAVEPGGIKVPANSVISFPSAPFPTAAVTNPLPFINGRDVESDQDLRDRIRDYIQALSRGTGQSIKSGIIGLIDENTNSSVVSVSIIPPVNIADGPTKVYIDNGRGLEPAFSSIGLETLVTQATGGEQFFQLQNFPIAKSTIISQKVEPFNLSGLETLVLNIGTDEETFTFASSDFETPSKAEATEIAEAINNRATLFEARTITDSDGRKVIISPRTRTNENMQLDSASTANEALNFSELEVFTLKLYKNDKLLTKDGLTASLISLAQPFNLSTNVVTTTDSDITVVPNSRIVTKTVPGVNPFNQFVHPGDYIKFSGDSDLFYTRVLTVVSDTKFILDSAYPNAGGGLGNIVIWNSPQLEVAANGDIEQTEVISFGPNDFANPSQALALEVYNRIVQELNLSKIELAVDNTKIKIISEVENSEMSKMQVTGGGAATALGFCIPASINGLVTFSGGSKVVTGAGTLFTSDLQEGQWIKANLDGAGSWTKIESIESDTVLYLTEGYRGENRAAVASSKINFSILSQGKNADYTLNRSNGQIELQVPLSANDSLTAGSINTRAFSDSIPELYDFDSLGLTSDLIVCIDGGFNGTVTIGDGSAPYDTFIDTSLIGYSASLFNGFYIEWISGANYGQTGFVSSYNNLTGQISTIAGFSNPISNGDKFVLCQVINFVHASDFADAQNATAAEVVAVINAQLFGGKAETTLTNEVRIRTGNFQSSGKVQIKGGLANSVLAFSTTEAENQLANLAFVQSGNSDRNGNPAAKGFTLGPGQNLVAILDNDSLNKTFAVSLEAKGVVTGVGVGTFTDSVLGSKYTDAGYFNEFWIYWTAGLNTGSVQLVTAYSGVSGIITYQDIFPNTLPNPISSGDEFSIVPRTAENAVKFLNDFNITTLSIVGDADVVGISGDFVQLATKLPGSKGKVYVTGGTANEIGIPIQSIPGGSPVNDLTVNSIAGLAKGLFVDISLDGTVTTGDSLVPYDTFIASVLTSAIPSYFTGMTIEFLTGNNAGHKTTISSYNNITGQFVLASATINQISINDTFRINSSAYIVDIQGTSAPYTLSLNDQSNAPIDVTEFSLARNGTIRDNNGFNFSNIQVEGVDGYKYFTSLIQKVQWTIDGIDHDPNNYPGIGAAGTQFEVLAPVLVKLKLIIDVTTEEGVSLSSVSDSISNAILEYVNSRGVGQDVVLSEIVTAAQSVGGVFDVTISNHSSNIVVADGELARLDSSDLIIG